MPTEDQMNVTEHRKYLKLMKARYVAAERAERGRLLTEMEQVTGLHRKSLTRLMVEMQCAQASVVYLAEVISL
jgi:hypothetical protein